MPSTGLVFIDRLLATLVHLRHGVTHDVLGCWFGVLGVRWHIHGTGHRKLTVHDGR